MTEEVAAFDPSLKKKKKKKVVNVEEVAAEAAAEGEINFGDKKKKKKPAKDKGEGVDAEDSGRKEAAGSAAETETSLGLSPWPYQYETLLERVYDIMHKKNPDMESGGKKKLIMKPPQCLRVGSKKTAWANFVEICNMLKRQPKHVLQFLLAELGTSGSLDGNNQLIIKGRFQQKQFESVLRNYIKEYVTCHTCKSPNTTLQKDTRLNFLQCEVCGSRCSVAAIKTGFTAQVGRRAAARAAAGQ